jgi:KipI family sensor histidine kinase inhibitor
MRIPCDHRAMGLRALGDSAWIFEAGGEDPIRRLQLVLKLVGILERERIPEVRDVVSSFASVAVHFDPSDGDLVLKWLTTLPPPPPDAEPGNAGRLVEIPVAYGEELENVAARLGRSEEEVVALHSSAEYQVAALGFSPGFPYLLGLPEELLLPRKSTPSRVPAGSVAIAGNQAGIYPVASQGGWHVLGKTDLRLFDPKISQPNLLIPGDRVRFKPVAKCKPPRKIRVPAMRKRGVRVIEAGAMTTVQDFGRPGWQKLGISPGGAADPVAAMVANRLVGNADDAAVLECCMSGPVLEFPFAARIAFTGWNHARSGRPLDIKAGETLDLRGHLTAVRGYIAIAGGFAVPMILGSRSTDVRGNFGGMHGRALASGDVLPVGKAQSGPVPGDWRIGWPHETGRGGMIELRFLTGMQSKWFSDETRESFTNSIYQISPVSDRMGTRLDGPPLHTLAENTLLSQPVVAGSVQVPPDGKPIILLSERQTIGGYPQIAHVISADIPKLARSWPGTPIRFREVTLDEARIAWQLLKDQSALLQTGLDLLR